MCSGRVGNSCSTSGTRCEDTIEAANRRTENTMVKRKRTRVISETCSVHQSIYLRFLEIISTNEWFMVVDATFNNISVIS